MHIQKSILIISLVSLFLLPITVSAATVSVQAIPTSVGMGDVLRVDVLLSSAVPVNAFSGILSYSKTILEPVAVSDGNSIISAWVTHPTVPSMDVPISFAGITPGGFSGERGTLFSILFRAKKSGTASVSLESIEVLRNDGTGGKEPVIVRPLSFFVAPEPLGGYTETVDQTPPEPFTAYLDTDEQLFGGRAYLVFTAVDKSSGVDHYAVAESRVPAFLFKLFPLSWTETTSPYVFVHQNLTSTVYLKAVDRAGNERLSIFPPPHLFTIYEKGVLLGILMVVVLLWQKGRGRRFWKRL